MGEVHRAGRLAGDRRLDAPHLRIARTAPGHFDFDDILARLARRPASPAGGAPARFAVYNIEVGGGTVDFDDRVVGRRHRIEGLSLGVPFVSDLPADAEVRVEPRLRFTLDGAPWDSRAAATPFRTERDALDLKSALLERYRTAKVQEFQGPTGFWVRIDPAGRQYAQAEAIQNWIGKPDDHAEAYLVRLD